MLLSEFRGNAGVISELSAVMKNNTFPHAVIIDGAKGTGKRTLAGIIAQYCVCSSDNKPCGICSDCIKAQKGIHPDIFVADGYNVGEMNIEAIRNIRTSAYIKPNEAEKKVYLLFNCEKMLQPAQNAFLKVLEEPPENVVFIMTAVSASSLLQTVRSRSRIFSLYPPDAEQTIKFLSDRFPDKTSDEISKATTDSGGNIGGAIELLKGESEEARLLAEQILSAIPLSTEYNLLLLTNKAVQNRAFAVNVLDALCELSAECVMASAGVKNVSSIAEETAKKLSGKRLISLQSKISRARYLINTNLNLNLYGTWLCAELRNG